MPTTHAPSFRVTGERIDNLVAAVISNRLDDVGVAVRQRLIDLLDGDSTAADRLINERTQDVENDPVYRIECDRLPNPIMLAAVNANHLADQISAYLGFYNDLPCEVSLDLVQGDGHVIPKDGATFPLFVTETSPIYTVKWMTQYGPRQMLQISGNRFNERLGKNLARRSALPPGHVHRAWDITVYDKNGQDVTAAFPLLTPRQDDGRIRFSETYVPIDATPAGVAAHLEQLVQRYPDQWEGGVSNGLGLFRWRQSGYVIEVQTAEGGRPAFMPLSAAIHRINAVALGLPITTSEKAVTRLVRVADGTAHLDRASLYQLATGAEVTA